MAGQVAWQDADDIEAVRAGLAGEIKLGRPHDPAPLPRRDGFGRRRLVGPGFDFDKTGEPGQGADNQIDFTGPGFHPPPEDTIAFQAQERRGENLAITAALFGGFTPFDANAFHRMATDLPELGPFGNPPEL